MSQSQVTVRSWREWEFFLGALICRNGVVGEAPPGAADGLYTEEEMWEKWYSLFGWTRCPEAFDLSTPPRLVRQDAGAWAMEESEDDLVGPEEPPPLVRSACIRPGFLGPPVTRQNAVVEAQENMGPLARQSAAQEDWDFPNVARILFPGELEEPLAMTH